MEKELFIDLLKENILSIFTGSEIICEEESSPRDALVAQGSGGTILIKFQKSDNYRIVIKRVQPFKIFEIELIKSIISELAVIYKHDLGEEYYGSLQEFVIEKAICKSISDRSYQTLLDIFDFMKMWGRRTYEGQKIRFGFIISHQKAPKGINPNMHIRNALSFDFSALISDGRNTCIELSSDGYIIGYTGVPPKLSAQDLYAPFDYLGIAKLSFGNRIGVALEGNGDILIFHDRNLIFAKRNGEWIRFSHEEIVYRLSDRLQDTSLETRRAIYISAIDTSFARTGGAVVHVSKGEEENILKHIDINDLMIEEYYLAKCNQHIQLSFFSSIGDDTTNIVPYEEFLRDERCVKTANLRRMIAGRKFYELPRKLRQEIMSIDGATIIDSQGRIMAAGAIIMIEAGSTGGGRLAATKTLARYGVAMKISADGGIQGFKMDKVKLKPMPIFVLG